MNERIEELKKQIKSSNERLERNNKQFEHNIENAKREMEQINKEFVIKVIDNILNEVHTIRYSIENWEYFCFNGFYMDRDENNVVLYMTDKEKNKYEIIVEDCEFKYNGNIEEEVLSDEMDTALRALNGVFD